MVWVSLGPCLSYQVQDWCHGATVLEYSRTNRVTGSSGVREQVVCLAYTI